MKCDFLFVSVTKKIQVIFKLHIPPLLLNILYYKKAEQQKPFCLFEIHFDLS